MTALSLVQRASPEGDTRPHYVRLAGAPSVEYYAFAPDNCPRQEPPLVLVHGISRNAAEMVLRFAPLARRHGVPLVAPLFTAEGFGKYQQLVDRRSGVRADRALLDILEDASSRWGIDTGRFSLFGFSGGAQFVHRFTFFHPERVLACIPVSAGWYTFPDPELAWPLGLAASPLGPVDPAALGAVPFQVIVGSRDRNDDESLRRNPELDRLQGTHRLQRARRWFRAMRKSGLHPASSLTELARTRHDFGQADRNGLTDLVFALLGYETQE